MSDELFVTPCIKDYLTHSYTCVYRGTVRVKCLVQEHNTVSPARAKTRIARSGVERTTHESTVPTRYIQGCFIFKLGMSVF